MITEYLAKLTDDEVKPRQHRHVSTLAWWMVQIDQPAPDAGIYLAEHCIDRWVPFDWEDEWILRRRNTGRVIRLSGGEPKSPQRDVLRSLWPVGEWHARGGHFRYGEEKRNVGEVPAASWSTPDPQFIAGIPLLPEPLLERLAGPRKVSAPPAPAVQFQNALSFLRTGLVPANVRHSLYDALTRLPVTRIIPGITNAAGTPAIAIAHKTENFNLMILIDQRDGRFLGEQQTTVDNVEGLPVGTVITSTAVHVTVVDTVPEGPVPADEPVAV